MNGLIALYYYRQRDQWYIHMCILGNCLSTDTTHHVYKLCGIWFYRISRVYLNSDIDVCCIPRKHIRQRGVCCCSRANIRAYRLNGLNVAVHASRTLAAVATFVNPHVAYAAIIPTTTISSLIHLFANKQRGCGKQRA